MLEDILKNLKNNNDIECFQVNNKVYTYNQLYKYVCNIYSYLLIENNTNSPVVVYGHKDIYMIASFLACSFAGMTYVPIDTGTPKDRYDSIINQVEPRIIIDKNIEKIMEKEKSCDIEKIYMQNDNVYYIIFTSGSTGIPKGVEVKYSNVISCINWLKSITEAEKEIILNQGNFSFDLSVADIYLSLTTNSKHYVLEKETQKDYGKLFEEIKNSNASIAVFTPSFAELLLLDKSFCKSLMPNLKQIIFCGETLLNKTVRKILDRFENIKIINCYGPTECTFAVTYEIITKDSNIDENVSIGIPKKDVEILILDESENVLEENEVGEIVILGESVAKGYFNNLNNNSFRKIKEKSAYFTGDLGYLQNGKLYYKCRKDKQIKLRGYRIELADIENSIYKLDYINSAVITKLENKDGNVSKIIGFVKLKNNNIKTSQDVINDLKLKLPDYMIPIIKIVDEIPLNNNGKADDKKLLEEYRNERRDNRNN